MLKVVDSVKSSHTLLIIAETKDLSLVISIDVIVEALNWSVERIETTENQRSQNTTCCKHLTRGNIYTVLF